MGTGFTVNVGEVRTHAQTVGNIAAQVRSVSSSAQDSVGGDAYGQIGQFFAAAITGAAAEIRDGINHASQTVNQVETGLQRAAAAYEAVDERHAQLFTGEPAQ